MWGENLATLFLKTGFTAWPLLLCSIIGVAIIFERAWYFYQIKLDYGQFTRKFFELLGQNKTKEAFLFCRKHPNPIVRIASLYLKSLDHPKRETILSREGSLAMEEAERRLRGLASITHIAPLLGLLGTVTGLVSAFVSVQGQTGGVHPEDLAGGIWEALLSTVFGLVIAIPCMAAYHTFESAADKIARRMQTIVAELDEFYSNDNRRTVYKQSFDPGEDIIEGVK
jgi:biopolymer transport protein ExbB